MKSNLIQQIGELIKKGDLKPAVEVAKQLHQSFPNDAQCGDIYAGVLHKLAIQLKEANTSESPKQAREHLKTAIEVAVSEEAKKRLQEILNDLDEPTKEDEAQIIITTERAVQMLREGVPGIKAWNQFREFEHNLPTLQGVDLSGRDLSGANLAGVDLRQSNLKEATLYNVNFSEANLSGANLDDANAYYADFSHANLSGAHLNGANANYANFSQANLSGAHLDDAKAEHTDFSQANLERATLKKARILFANFSKAKLNRSDLTEVFGYHSAYREQHAVILENADLSDAVVVSANLRQCNLEKATLTRTNFAGAILYGANLKNASLLDTSFRKADLRQADLTGTRFYFAVTDQGTQSDGMKL